MLVKSVSAVVILAVTAHASAAEPMPYRPLVKMSVHQMFGLGRRQSAGYQPTQTVCGTGATCADACGAGYVQCASNDDNTHCYDPAAQQTCCPDGTGNSCDSGYYCTQDTQGNTWCCPDGLSLTACAAAYSITGSLVSETASPTSSAASSTTAPITSSTTPGNSSVTTDIETDTVTTCPSAGTTLSYPSSNSTLATITPTQSPTQVVVSGANAAGPAGALIVVAVAAIAALL